MKAAHIFLLLALAPLFMACQPDRKEIRSNRWEVNYLRAAEADSNWTAPGDYTLEFPERNQFSLRLDVNTCGGAADFRINSGIRFDGIYCTEACCDSEFAAQLLQLLPKVKQYEWSDEQLVLKGENGLQIFLTRK
jgi:heat shock protein HslJ